MNQPSASTQYSLKLVIPGADDEEQLDRMARSLRSEIRDLGVDSVSLDSELQAPAGTKGLAAVIPGALTIKALGSLAPKLLELLGGWVMRGQNQVVQIEIQHGENKVKLSYTPKSTTHEDIQALVKQLNQNIA